MYNVNVLCGYEMGEESEKQADGLNNALAADGVSDDIKRALGQGRDALRACMELAPRVLEALEARGSGLEETLRRHAEAAEEEEAEEEHDEEDEEDEEAKENWEDIDDDDDDDEIT